MGRYMGLCVTFVLIGLASPTAHAQQLRSEVGLTTERQGVSVNIDAHYIHAKSKVFALARLFINEAESSTQAAGLESSLKIEAAVGRRFGKGIYLVGPLVGLDSEKRVIAGADFVTKVRHHTTAYLGYVRLATDSKSRNGMRHRVMFDLKKDQKLFLRLDWKTEGNDQEHCRLGVEFHTRIDKMNLPIYLEPFWNFEARQIGIRVGTRL